MRAPVLLAALVMTAVSCSSGAAGGGTATTSTTTLHAGTQVHAVSWSEVQRTYLLHRPLETPVSRPPLVVVLHGASLSAAQTERYYRWDDVADTEGFAVAYPQGIDNAWNAGSCCSDAPYRGTDDVGFIAAVFDDAVRTVGADPTRVYLAGVSNGAMLAVRFACDRPGLFAAIGSVAGTITSPCDQLAPVSFMAIHGLADQVVRYPPGPGTVESGPGLRLPVTETIDRFMAADGCVNPNESVAAPVHTISVTCGHGTSVQVITVDGAGHQWPGATLDPKRAAEDGPANQPSTALDATTALWTFFATQRLGPRG